VIVVANEHSVVKPPIRISFGPEVVEAEAYIPPNPGPYPYNTPKQNHIRFTPTQIAAIHSGMNEGMTLIVGPPGTGKTDVAVQIISNWYHNFPNQRILLVTHSNQALNQLFDKIAALGKFFSLCFRSSFLLELLLIPFLLCSSSDVDERHLLRLGHGQETLETEGDFSKTGRVNHMLKRRLFLLVEIGRMAKALSVTEDVHYTCETAIIFFQQQVVPRWEEFKRKMLVFSFFPSSLSSSVD
jgi:intron-binding protein aquarius